MDHINFFFKRKLHDYVCRPCSDYIGFYFNVRWQSADPNVFNEAEIYSARRITIAPILILLGLVIEGYAIMKNQLLNFFLIFHEFI